jgi:hypothetical protein
VSALVLLSKPTLAREHGLAILGASPGEGSSNELPMIRKSILMYVIPGVSVITARDAMIET